MSATLISQASSLRISGAKAVSCFPSLLFRAKSNSTTRYWRGPDRGLGMFGNLAALGKPISPEHRGRHDEGLVGQASAPFAAASCGKVIAGHTTAQPWVPRKHGVDDLFGLNRLAIDLHRRSFMQCSQGDAFPAYLLDHHHIGVWPRRSARGCYDASRAVAVSGVARTPIRGYPLPGKLAGILDGRLDFPVRDKAPAAVAEFPQPRCKFPRRCGKDAA